MPTRPLSRAPRPCRSRRRPAPSRPRRTWRSPSSRRRSSRSWSAAPALDAVADTGLRPGPEPGEPLGGLQLRVGRRLWWCQHRQARLERRRPVRVHPRGRRRRERAPRPRTRCFGHWLVDSVEVLLDPRGDSVDTSTTFKSGIFPFTDDAGNSNGNGVNGPCWSRDADNHQGFSTGPLAATVKDGPNSPGQQVAVQAVVNPDGTYAGGGWNVEVKIPLANLPAAVGPTSTAPTGVAGDQHGRPAVPGSQRHAVRLGPARLHR